MTLRLLVGIVNVAFTPQTEIMEICLDKVIGADLMKVGLVWGGRGVFKLMPRIIFLSSATISSHFVRVSVDRRFQCS